jgi:hypothetical protein
MNKKRTAKVSAMLLAFLLSGESTPAWAQPTPVPGGANQKAGVTGTFSQVLFNGRLRLRGMSLKDAVPADNMRPNAAGERALVFRVIVSNGTQRESHGYFDAALSDANGITISGRPLDDGWTLEQGAAAREAIGFSVPADFVPTKLVLTTAAAPNEKVFRITIRSTDLSAASAAPSSNEPNGK